MKTMQSKACIFSFFLLCFVLSIHAQPPQNFCRYTSYSNFCRSNLPNNRSATIQDCGRNFVYQSISVTSQFLSLINGFLQNPQYPESVIRALLDCQNLATRNGDFLGNTIQAIRYAHNLSNSDADDTQVMLDASLTNHQTCMNGLQEVYADPSILSALSALFATGSQSYSVTLTFFKHGWGDYSNGWRWQWTRGFRRNRVGQFPPVGVKVNTTVFVNPNGSGDYTNISDAVAAAPNKTTASNGYFVINIAPGVYQEYVSIPKNTMYVMMIGAGINRTIITGSRSVVDGWTTFSSATFVVEGQGFVAEKITFQNTAGAIKMQAVAVRNDADLSAFYECSFEGYQDTLYTHSMRQFYKNCDIYGTIDFIFGNAAVVVQSCNIYARLPIPGQFNTITAQGKTDPNQNTGTSIQSCVITAAPDLASTNQTVQTYLGRPWKNYSTVAVMESYLASLINPAGWSIWIGDEFLTTLYYAEYDNYGPGSNTSNRVQWPGYHIINTTDAANFTVANFIQGNVWLNGTGVPYASGLSN